MTEKDIELLTRAQRIIFQFVVRAEKQRLGRLYPSEEKPINKNKKSYTQKELKQFERLRQEELTDIEIRPIRNIHRHLETLVLYEKAIKARSAAPRSNGRQD